MAEAEQRFMVIINSHEEDNEWAGMFIEADNPYDAYIRLGRTAAICAGVTRFDRTARPGEIIVRPFDELWEDAKALLEQDDVLLVTVEGATSSLAAVYEGAKREHQARTDSVRAASMSQEERERQGYLRLKAKFSPDEGDDPSEEVDVRSASSAPVGGNPTCAGDCSYDRRGRDSTG